MSNQGFFELSLLDVSGVPVNDSKVSVSFFRTAEHKEISKHVNLSFPPPHRFVLPAFPQEKNLIAEVTASKFRTRKSAVFTLTDRETITRNLTLFRAPDKWTAQFDGWNQLPNYQLPLKKVLEKSATLAVKGGEMIGKFTQSAYDNVTEAKMVFAKSALLNLYAKLTEMVEPVGGAEPWFSFAREIVQIGRERIIAVVDPRMYGIVRTIGTNIRRFPEYEKASAALHFGNFPSAYQIVKSKMVSVKSNEDRGNVQLTIAHGKDSSGNGMFLLDADIDENGKLMAHLADLFKHKFSGGTHPYDIYEFLVLSGPSRQLGYQLT